MAINVDGIPDELKKLNQWVLWNLEKKDGKLTKVPYQTNGYGADKTKPSNWTTFQNVTRVFGYGDYNGIGFIFTEQDPYCGIDFDHCVDPDTKEIKGWVKEKLKILNSYTEYSQSGLGFHVFVKGNIPRHIKGNNISGRKNKKIGFEIYDQAWYFCMSGNVLNGSLSIEERQAEIEQICNEIFGKTESKELPKREPSTSNLSDSEIINIIRKSKQSNKFSKLFDHGDCSDYLKSDGTADQSSGDMALVDIIAFYTQDFQQILSIMKQSALYDDKWEREDYQGRTIEKALSWSGDRYSPGGNHSNNDKSSKGDPVVEKADVRTVVVETEPLQKDQYKSTFPNIYNDLFNRYMNLMSDVTEAPASYHFFTFAVILGMLFDRKLYIEWSEGRLYPNLFVLLVGRSGIERKSTCLRIAKDLLHSVATDIKTFGSLSTWEGLLEAMKPDDTEPNVKTNISVICLNEFDSLLRKARNDTIAHLLPKLCELYDCESTVESITKSNPIKIKNPFVSIMAGVQPEIIEESFKAGDVQGGLAGRFMYVYDLTDKSIPIPEQINKNDYNRLITELGGIRADIKELKEGYEITLDKNSEAGKAFTTFYKWYRQQYINIPLLRTLNDRLQNHVLKLAMLFTYLDREHEIKAKQMQDAINIASWLLENNRKLFGMVGMTENEKIEYKVIEILKNANKTKREIHQSIGGRITGEQLNRVINSLLSLRVIREIRVDKKMVLSLNKC